MAQRNKSHASHAMTAIRCARCDPTTDDLVIPSGKKFMPALFPPRAAAVARNGEMANQ
jgi:hypothetical protein